MNERNFLRGLPAALGAGVAAGAAAQPRRRVLIQIAPLAGFQYHAGEEVWPQWAADQPLSIVLERGNPPRQRCRGYRLARLQARRPVARAAHRSSADVGSRGKIARAGCPGSYIDRFMAAGEDSMGPRNRNGDEHGSQSPFRKRAEKPNGSSHISFRRRVKQ